MASKKKKKQDPKGPSPGLTALIQSIKPLPVPKPAEKVIFHVDSRSNAAKAGKKKKGKPKQLGSTVEFPIPDGLGADALTTLLGSLGTIAGSKAQAPTEGTTSKPSGSIGKGKGKPTATTGPTVNFPIPDGLGDDAISSLLKNLGAKAQFPKKGTNTKPGKRHTGKSTGKTRPRGPTVEFPVGAMPEGLGNSPFEVLESLGKKAQFPTEGFHEPHQPVHTAEPPSKEAAHPIKFDTEEDFRRAALQVKADDTISKLVDQKLDREDPRERSKDTSTPDGPPTMRQEPERNILEDALKIADAEQKAQVAQQKMAIDAQKHGSEMVTAQQQLEKSATDLQIAQDKAAVSRLQTEQVTGASDDTALDQDIANAVISAVNTPVDPTSSINAFSGTQLEGPPAPSLSPDGVPDFVKTALGAKSNELMEQAEAISERSLEEIARLTREGAGNDLFLTPFGKGGLLAGAALNALSLPFTALGLTDEGLGTALLGGDATGKELDKHLSKLRTLSPILNAQINAQLQASDAQLAAHTLHMRSVEANLRVKSGAAKAAELTAKHESDLRNYIKLFNVAAVEELAGESKEIQQLFVGGQAGTEDESIGNTGTPTAKGSKLFVMFQQAAAGNMPLERFETEADLLVRSLIENNDQITRADFEKGVGKWRDGIRRRFGTREVDEFATATSRDTVSMKNAAVESYTDLLDAFMQQGERFDKVRKQMGKEAADTAIKDKASAKIQKAAKLKRIRAENKIKQEIFQKKHGNKIPGQLLLENLLGVNRFEGLTPEEASKRIAEINAERDRRRNSKPARSRGINK